MYQIKCYFVKDKCMQTSVNRAETIHVSNFKLPSTVFLNLQHFTFKANFDSKFWNNNMFIESSCKKNHVHYVSALFEKTERVVAGKCCSFLIKTIALINAKTFSPSGILPSFLFHIQAILRWYNLGNFLFHLTTWVVLGRTRSRPVN